MPIKISNIFVVLLLTALLQPCVYAKAKTDKVHIKSDRVEMNYKTGVTRYIGHVVVTSSETIATGSKMLTEQNDNNKLSQATIFGNEAHLTIKDKKDPLYAKAKIIKLFPQSHMIELIEHARATQHGNSISAPRMTYNTKTKVLQSESTKKSQAHIELLNHPSA